MKSNTKIWGQIVILCICSASALSQAPTTLDSTKTSQLSDVVSQMEEEFLSKIESAPGLELVFDEYELRIEKLILKYPGQAEPFLGLMELFEKCEPARTKRLLDESLGRPDLPDKIRIAYEILRKRASLVGAPIDLAFTALDGKRVQLNQFSGQVVVIDFWATWCGPCIRELPKLQALYAKHHRYGLVIIGISFDRERSKLDSFLKMRQIPWAQIYPTMEERENISRYLGVTGGYLPVVFILGKDGKLRHTMDSRFRIEEKLAVLLKE